MLGTNKALSTCVAILDSFNSALKSTILLIKRTNITRVVKFHYPNETIIDVFAHYYPVNIGKQAENSKGSRRPNQGNSNQKGHFSEGLRSL